MKGRTCIGWPQTKRFSVRPMHNQQAAYIYGLARRWQYKSKAFATPSIIRLAAGFLPAPLFSYPFLFCQPCLQPLPECLPQFSHELNAHLHLPSPSPLHHCPKTRSTPITGTGRSLGISIALGRSGHCYVIPWCCAIRLGPEHQFIISPTTGILHFKHLICKIHFLHKIYTIN